MLDKYGEHTVKKMDNAVEIYTDPRMVMRVKNFKRAKSNYDRVT